jgi:hypothetical protein
VRSKHKKPPAKLPALSIIPPLTVSRQVAARSLGVGLTALDGIIAAKLLRVSKIGRRVLIRVSDLERLLDKTAVA